MNQSMNQSLLRLAATTLALAMTWAVPAQAAKPGHPAAGGPGDWRLIGITHADHTADHDTIRVPGPFDNFSRIKFKVTDAPLNMQHMVVTSVTAPTPLAWW
jgi:hypothetical protein